MPESGTSVWTSMPDFFGNLEIWRNKSGTGVCPIWQQSGNNLATIWQQSGKDKKWKKHIWHNLRSHPICILKGRAKQKTVSLRAYLQSLRDRRWRGQKISLPLRVSRARGSGHKKKSREKLSPTNPKIWSDPCCHKVHHFFSCASRTCLTFLKMDSRTTVAQLLQGSKSLCFANFGNNNMFPKSINVSVALGPLLGPLLTCFVPTSGMI